MSSKYFPGLQGSHDRDRAAFSKLKHPTGGEWTEQVAYDAANKEMEIKFANGFEAVYPNVNRSQYDKIVTGSKAKDGRSNSVGAALHKSPSIMTNYRGGSFDD
jgi:hypothetical protein